MSSRRASHLSCLSSSVEEAPLDEQQLRQVRLEQIEERLTEAGKEYLHAIGGSIEGREKAKLAEVKREEKEIKDAVEAVIAKQGKDIVGKAKMHPADALRIVLEEKKARELLPEREQHFKDMYGSIAEVRVTSEVVKLHGEIRALRAEKQFLAETRNFSSRLQFDKRRRTPDRRGTFSP